MCKFHLQGRCKNAEWCHFEHPAVEHALGVSKREWTPPVATAKLPVATKAAAPAATPLKPAISKAAAPAALKSAASSRSLAQCGVTEAAAASTAPAGEGWGEGEGEGQG